MPLLLWLGLLLQYCHRHLKQWFHRFFPDKSLPHYGRRKPKPGENKKPVYYRALPKPEWVKQEIIRLKALMPEAGCRTLADVFNRRYAMKRQITVGKTYVGYTIQRNHYEIQILRRKNKHKKPRPLPKNLIWGLDLTGKTDTQGKLHNILGILEHRSRVTLTLTALKDKTTITLLRYLLDAVERFDKPKLIRTDNEAIFKSWLFRLALVLLGIRHQRIDLHCPWQNGRIERFFGTLKAKLDQWEVESLTQLNGALGQFRCWYNHVRPHQYLDGRTPAEVWQGRDVFTTRPKQEYWFEAWEGLLTGFHLRV